MQLKGCAKRAEASSACIFCEGASVSQARMLFKKFSVPAGGAAHTGMALPSALQKENGTPIEQAFRREV
jgi:hypothetical protein